MKKLLYICLPIIALSLVAANGWSAQAQEPGKRPGMEQEFGRGGPGGPGGPGEMHGHKGPGGPGDSKLGIPHGRWWKRKGVQEKLNLSSEQIAKLEKISLEGRKAMIKQRAELEIIELELEPLMEAKQFDREKIENVLDKMEGIRAKMAKERIKSLLDTREVLTSEQFKTLKEIKGKRGGRGERGGQSRGPGQKGPQHRAQR